jgi:hypothetical protein
MMKRFGLPSLKKSTTSVNSGNSGGAVDATSPAAQSSQSLRAGSPSAADQASVYSSSSPLGSGSRLGGMFGHFRQKSISSRASTESKQSVNSKNSSMSLSSAHSKVPISSTFGGSADCLSVDSERLFAPLVIIPKKLNTLQKVIYENDIKTLKNLFLDRKRDMNKTDTYHRISALHVAVEMNKSEMVQVLLDPLKAFSKSDRDYAKMEQLMEMPLKVTKVNASNQEGRTPLHLV